MIEGWHFQNAYIVDDLEEGMAVLRARGFDGKFTVFETDQELSSLSGPVRGANRICLTWRGDLQIELIQPLIDPHGMYSHAQSNGGPLRFHHICMRVDDWAAFRARVERQDLPVTVEMDFGENGIKALYLDGRKDYGHYLEYTWIPDEIWKSADSLSSRLASPTGGARGGR